MTRLKNPKYKLKRQLGGLLPHWLFQQLTDAPNPIFALQSSLNWVQSLAFDIKDVYGISATDQINSLNGNVHLQSIQNNQNPGAVDVGELFSALFRAINFNLSLKTSMNSGDNFSWNYPPAIVTWYYVNYNSFRAMNICYSNTLTDTHAKMINMMSNFRRFLPHPFNQIATWQNAENYNLSFPDFPNTNLYNLTQAFSQNGDNCRGMVLQYLKGTAAWRMDQAKERLKKTHRLNDFRTNAAKALRDQNAPMTINFLDCAFRYRGKANYRDSIFLTYGDEDARFQGQFLSALYESSLFSILTAAKFIEQRMGRNLLQNFINDVEANLRSINRIPPADRYWNQL